MSEQALIMYASPTLAGMKTGSLFTQPCEDRQQLLDEVRTFNRRLSPKGICLVPIRIKGGKALLYLFRPSHLNRDLEHSTVRNILENAGYECRGMASCICSLIKKFSETDDFPHEIGVFLGYPPEDVEGFITNGAKNCKCTGVWKVYGDVDAAQATFRRYHDCTECYRRQWASGVSLERLLVAV